LVIAKNMGRFQTNHPGLANVVGPFRGELSNRGERLALARPEDTPGWPGSHSGTNLVYPVVDEVSYGTGGSWGRWSDGGGASLELASPEGDHDLAGHWRDSAEPQGAP